MNNHAFLNENNTDIIFSKTKLLDLVDNKGCNMWEIVVCNVIRYCHLTNYIKHVLSFQKCDNYEDFENISKIIKTDNKEISYAENTYTDPAHVASAKIQEKLFIVTNFNNLSF